MRVDLVKRRTILGMDKSRPKPPTSTKNIPKVQQLSSKKITDHNTKLTAPKTIRK